jgi:hypothetical protein
MVPWLVCQALLERMVLLPDLPVRMVLRVEFLAMEISLLLQPAHSLPILKAVSHRRQEPVFHKCPLSMA